MKNTKIKTEAAYESLSFRTAFGWLYNIFFNPHPGQNNFSAV